MQILGFYGTFNFQIDENRRLSIPSEFRRQIPEDQQIVYLRCGDGCIQVFPPTIMEQILSEYKAKPVFDHLVRDKKRRIGVQFLARSIDPQGRIRIPEEFVKYAKLKREVVIVGAVTDFEIWAKDEWKKETRTFTDQPIVAGEP